jgi:hypothetical protein
MSKIKNIWLEDVPSKTLKGNNSLDTGAVQDLSASEVFAMLGLSDLLADVALAKMGGDAFMHVQDQKPQGTYGGTFTAGAWRTRDLNTVLTNTITGASLDSNQITLPAGKYYVEASVPAYLVTYNVVRLQDIDNASVLLLGPASRANGLEWWEGGSMTAVFSNVFSHLAGMVALSATSKLELQHICSYSYALGGFGMATDLATEIYSDIRIWRIGDYVAP